MTITREELILLFDIYQDLLTEKQRDYFISYYFQDLSISEIAEEFGISRNAVFDQVKNVCNILVNYEEKLKINTKNKLLLEVLKIEDIEIIKGKIKAIIEE